MKNLMNFRKKNNKIIMIFSICIFNTSCVSNTINTPISYQNTNYTYLTNTKGVHVLNTDNSRVIDIINENKNSRNVGIINYGKNIIINNIENSSLDTYLVEQNKFTKTSETKVTDPIVDISYSNDEAYLISEKKISFIKIVDNNIKELSSIPFSQSKFEKSVFLKNSNELYIYDSINQEVIIVNTNKREVIGTIEISQSISLGGLDIDKDKRLFLTDKSKSDIYIYSVNKKELIKKITIPTTDGIFSQPTDIKVYQNKKIYVANNNINLTSVIDYKNLEIIGEIKYPYTSQNAKPYKLSFVELSDKKVYLLEICHDCTNNYDFIDLDTDKYKILFSSENSEKNNYDFVATPNILDASY